MGRKNRVRVRARPGTHGSSRKGQLVVATPSEMSTAAGSVGVSAAAASFALHSVLLQSNPNRSRVSGYTDKQNILLVGEGDFSWALSLAVTLVRCARRSCVPGAAVAHGRHTRCVAMEVP